MSSSDVERTNDAFHAGFRAGVLATKRGRLVRVPMQCPHCGGLVVLDRATLVVLGNVAKDADHKRELWLAYTAGEHGHCQPSEAG